MRFTPFIFALVSIAVMVQECTAVGALYVRPLNSQQTYTVMSIKTHDAVVKIQDQVAETHVDQTFYNDMSARVESTFIFPLPEGAVITELIYWFNGRKYSASLREREEAQKAYNDKIRQYIDPALLQYFGENVFKLNIAPIEPYSLVRFEITYAELLPYEFGNINYRYYLNTTGLSPKPLERVSISVDATTTKTFTTFFSPSHGNSTAAQAVQIAPDHYTFNFGDENFVPGHDLLLSFDTRRPGVDMNVLTYVPTPADSFGVDKFYALWITPPDTVITENIPPRDIVFTADISSSMEGKRILRLKEALAVFLDELTPNDRFDLVVFSTSVLRFREDLVPATPENIADARKFVSKLGALGLTNIDAALRHSLDMTFDTTKENILIFMTDGSPTAGDTGIASIVANTSALNTSGVRIYPFGIGDGLSRTLLDDLGKRNNGYSTYISADDSIATAIANYFRRLSFTAYTDLELDFDGLQIYDQYARVLPNLQWGSQVLQFGRYINAGTFPVQLSGMNGTKPFVMTTPVSFGDIKGGNRAVARLWASRKIDFLLNEITLYGEKKELVDAVIDLSIRFGILTPYTAFYVDPTEENPVPTGTEDEILVAKRTTLMQNEPNPFVDRTTIGFSIPPGAGRERVRITVYDQTGRMVALLFDAEVSTGNYSATWDGTDISGTRLPAGAYLYTLESGSTRLSRTLILLQ